MTSVTMRRTSPWWEGVGLSDILCSYLTTGSGETRHRRGLPRRCRRENRLFRWGHATRVAQALDAAQHLLGFLARAGRPDAVALHLDHDRAGLAGHVRHAVA